VVLASWNPTALPFLLRCRKPLRRVYDGARFLEFKHGISDYFMPKPTVSAQEQLLSILRRAPNRLEYLTANDWALLIDRAKEVSFQKDEILIQKGMQAKMIYFLVKGTARIEADFKARVAQIGPGQVAGEMAFLENDVASATVTAEEELKAYAVEWSDLVDLFELFPHLASRFYRSLAVILAHRLRDQIMGEAWR